MKLEIKHLAAYLPYGLHFLMESEPNSKEPNIDELKSIDAGINIINFGLGNAKFITEIKPLLRSLSDLTKEIEVNGERFVPIDYLWFSVIGTDADSFNKDDFYENCELGAIEFLPFKVIPLLFEWHFDCFGLIEAGLAIDLNTIK